MTKLPWSGFDVIVDGVFDMLAGLNFSSVPFRKVARVPDIQPKSPSGEIFSLRKNVFEEPSAMSLNFVLLPKKKTPSLSLSSGTSLLE
jgi:hypothetical protein